MAYNPPVYSMPMDVQLPSPMYTPPVDMGVYGGVVPQPMPPLPADMGLQGGIVPRQMPQPLPANMGMQGPPLPANMGMQGGVLPQQMPLQDVPHPDIIAEEQRRQLNQAKVNLDLKIKELTEANEQHKQGLAEQANQQLKTMADQANQQMQEYAMRLDEQVKQSGSLLQQQMQQSESQADTALRASIEGHMRTVADYERRLQEQAKQSEARYKEKLVKDAIDKAQHEYKVTEAKAKVELEEQLKKAKELSAGGATASADDWAKRAQARYDEQVQALQQTMQEYIKKASEQPI